MGVLVENPGKKEKEIVKKKKNKPLLLEKEMRGELRKPQSEEMKTSR